MMFFGATTGTWWANGDFRLRMKVSKTQECGAVFVKEVRRERRTRLPNVPGFLAGVGGQEKFAFCEPSGANASICQVIQGG